MAHGVAAAHAADRDALPQVRAHEPESAGVAMVRHNSAEQRRQRHAADVETAQLETAQAKTDVELTAVRAQIAAVEPSSSFRAGGAPGGPPPGEFAAAAAPKPSVAVAVAEAGAGESAGRATSWSARVGGWTERVGWTGVAAEPQPEPEPAAAAAAAAAAARHFSGDLGASVAGGTEDDWDLPSTPSDMTVPPRLMEYVLKLLDKDAPAPIVEAARRIVQYLYQPRRWVPDGASCGARDCRLVFGHWQRCHHCRVCGGCFCSTCAPVTSELDGDDRTSSALADNVALPDFAQLLTAPVEPARHLGAVFDYVAPAASSWLSTPAELAPGAEYRRCTACASMLKAAALPEVMAVLPELREAIGRMRHRRVQRKLKHHPLSQDEVGHLRRRFVEAPGTFAGHSHWLMQLLLRPECIRWGEPAEAAKAIGLLSAPRQSDCKLWWCSRHCRDKLPPGDVVAILCSLADEPGCAPAGPALLELLAEGLAECCGGEGEELRAYLGPLVGTLASPMWVGQACATTGLRLGRSRLADALVSLTKASPPLHTQLFWLLEVARGACAGPDRTAAAMQAGYRELQNRLVVALDRPDAAALLGGQLLWAGLTSVDELASLADPTGIISPVADGVSYLFSGAAALLSTPAPLPEAVQLLEAVARGEAPPRESSTPPPASADAAGVVELQERVAELHAALFSGSTAAAAAALPVLPKWAVVGLEHSSVKRMKSKTRPFMLNCLCHEMVASGGGGEPELPRLPVRVMVKQHDDLRKDRVATELVAHCRDILARELPELALPVVCYRVLPAAVDAGMMEVVGDAATVFDITVRYDTSGTTHQASRLMHYIIKHNAAALDAALDRFR